MKHLIFIALAFITFQATAQHQQRGHRDGNRKARALKSLSADELAEIQTKRMTLHLDLSEAQQKEVQQLILQQVKARKEKVKSFKQRRADENAERLSKEDRLEALNERLDHQIAMKREMKSILNANQYEKWQKSKRLQKRRIAKRKRHH